MRASLRALLLLTALAALYTTFAAEGFERVPVRALGDPGMHDGLTMVSAPAERSRGLEPTLRDGSQDKHVAGSHWPPRASLLCADSAYLGAAAPHALLPPTYLVTRRLRI